MEKVTQTVLDAFDAMWGLYPEPVMLIHASRDILAVNRKAEELGVPTEGKCYSLYPSDKPCPGCLANKMLRYGEAVRKIGPSRGRFLDGYWIPVKGNADIYVHFGNDISEYVKPELLAE